MLRTIECFLEGPKEAKVRSEKKDKPAVYEASDKRTYVVAILKGGRDPKSKVIMQEDSCAIFAAKEELNTFLVGDKVYVKDGE